ncbi:hypothetical protein DXG01_012957 [Tephrocybe rancida]|nr:hypothetical protein DXG01_012957 [Tephrocybe rancida]
MAVLSLEVDGFEKLHDYAHQYNLRIVIWNRRDYPGSTKYSDAEIDDLNNGRKVFLDRLAVQVADFLKQYIEKESIPKISADRKFGGFAIMGWSMGTATAMPLFSDPSLLSPELYSLLEQYVKDLVLDDPPYVSFGIVLPEKEKTYDPWTDKGCKTPEEIQQNFGFWVSSYFTHPDVSGTIHGLNHERRAEVNTITSWTPEQLQRFYNEPAAARSDVRMHIPPMQATLHDLTHRVLYDEKIIKSLFPEVPVTYIGATNTNWHCIWGWIQSIRIYNEYLAKGVKAHWDKPQELMEFIVAGTTGR